MKKLIFFLITLVALGLTAMAQDSLFYYCGSEKIPLIENPQKLVTISPFTESRSILTNGFELIDTVSDDKSHIRVYQYNGTTHAPSQARSLARQTNQFASAVQPCYINRTGLELIPNGYIYIELKSAPDSTLLDNICTEYKLEFVRHDEILSMFYTFRQLPTSNQSAVDVANAIYETGLFESVSPSFSFNGEEISYDADAHRQWNLYNREYEDVDISVSSAWNYATGRGIKIAIIDRVIDSNHPDLAANIDTIINVGVIDSALVSDHGTHCAGIAAAVRNNGIGIAGVAPDAKLIPINVTYSLQSIPEVYFGTAIEEAYQEGDADIISFSWGCTDSRYIKRAIDLVLMNGRDGKGCIFVKSAGNTGEAITFPGYYNGVLAIGNITKTGIIADDSSRGDSLFVVAPGDSVWTTAVGGLITKSQGTSMSAPHVAGVVALILERNPNLTAEQVREIIARNAKKVGHLPYDKEREYGSWNEVYGYGLVNAYEAVKNTPLITLTPITTRQEDEDLKTN